jgi:hypothetical protein
MPPSAIDIFLCFADGEKVYGLFRCAGILSRILLCLLYAIIATDNDLLAANFDLDASILDFPIADRTLFSGHDYPFDGIQRMNRSDHRW